MKKNEKSNESEEVVEGKIEEPEKSEKIEAKKPLIDVSGWKEKTGIGKKIKKGEIKNIDEIIDKGMKIKEPEIVDVLIPDVKIDLLLIGQSKGKFGGGQRRVFKQTQKKTQEGNKPKFATCAVVGNENGYVGVGYGKSKETVPAREKAIRNAKMSVIKIKRGCGSWQCSCKEPHSIPFMVEGKCSSSVIKLMPAPKGTGLCVEKECSKILKAAGIRDVRSKTKGQTKKKINLIKACVVALEKLSLTKIKPDYYKELGIIEGKLDEKENE